MIDYFLSTARMRQVRPSLLDRLRDELDREIADQNGIAVSSDFGVLIARPLSLAVQFEGRFIFALKAPHH